MGSAAAGPLALADGTVLAIIEGALPVFSLTGALAAVGGGRVWRRLAGVAVIATLAGTLALLLPGTLGMVLIGLVVAIGFLAWVSPQARPPSTSR